MKLFSSRFIALLLFFSCSLNGFSQLFENGDRVCFVGNSITHAGEFHHNILQYYVTRFPDKFVTFYNCGISGDVTGGVLNRMESDILVHKPTHAVIMIGMNDIMRAYYRPYKVLNKDTLQKREASITLYKRNLDSIVRILLSKSVKVILQKPSIYDETAKIPTENKVGANGALKVCADYMQQLANKYQLQTVDYWTLMTNINQNIQKKDSAATIVGPDRIHPGASGNLVMSYQFLKTTNAPLYVSKIVVSKKKADVISKSVNCSIDQVSYDTKGVVFQCIEKALPLVFNEWYKNGLALVPYEQDLNQELLQVCDLSTGSYELKIDSVSVGVFSSADLKSGLNLALKSNTPQYRQSVEVKKVLVKLWENESKLRGIKHLEYNHLKNFKNKADVGLATAYLDSIFAPKSPTNTYLKQQVEKYKVNKINEKAIEKELEDFRVKIHQLAQPVVHTFTLSALKK